MAGPLGKTVSSSRLAYSLRAGPGGVYERGELALGFPGNLRGTATSYQQSQRMGDPAQQLLDLLRWRAPGHRRSEATGAEVGTAQRGEAERAGREAVVRVSHSTDEAGKPDPRGAGGGKGTLGSKPSGRPDGTQEPLEGKTKGHRA